MQRNSKCRGQQSRVVTACTLKLMRDPKKTQNQDGRKEKATVSHFKKDRNYGGRHLGKCNMLLATSFSILTCSLELAWGFHPPSILSSLSSSPLKQFQLAHPWRCLLSPFRILTAFVWVGDADFQLTHWHGQMGGLMRPYNQLNQNGINSPSSEAFTILWMSKSKQKGSSMSPRSHSDQRRAGPKFLFRTLTSRSQPNLTNLSDLARVFTASQLHRHWVPPMQSVTVTSAGLSTPTHSTYCSNLLYFSGPHAGSWIQWYHSTS